MATVAGSDQVSVDNSQASDEGFSMDTSTIQNMATVAGNDQVSIHKTQTSDEGSSLDTDPYHYTKRGEFTSELFKIEISNLPKYYGYVEFKKLLHKLGLKPRKVKNIPRTSVAFVTFDNEKEREAALAALKGHTWKKKELDAKIAKPVVDPVTMKRKNEVEGKEEPPKMPKLSIEESVSQAVTPLAHLPYEDQLNTKQGEMEEFLKTLTKEFHREIPEMRQWLSMQKSRHDGKCCELEKIKPSPIIDGYRNKCEFTIGKSSTGKDKTIGFRIGKYKHGSTAVAPPLSCRNVPPACKKVVENMQAYMDQSELQSVDPVTHEGHWSLLTVRTTEGPEVMATLSLHLQDISKEDFEAERKKLREYFSPSGPGGDSGITSLYMMLCGKRLKELGIDSRVCHITGDTHITEDLLGLKFRVSQDSFFQVNTKAAEVLFQTAGDWAEVSGDTVLLDVCCGTGTIGLSLANRVKRVIGVDICQPAINDAKVNAQNNGVTNATYICGKAEAILPNVMEGIRHSETVLGILDPPRAGLHMKVLQAIRKCKGLKRLVFLSCNPRLASNNFKDLCRPTSIRYKGTPFRLTKAVPVDLFPHAKHCELVLLFEREDEVRGGSNAKDVEGRSTVVEAAPPETGGEPSAGKTSDASDAINDSKDDSSTLNDVDAGAAICILPTAGARKDSEPVSGTPEQPSGGKLSDSSTTKDAGSVTMDE